MPNPKHRDLLEKWGLTALKLSFGFLEAEFAPRDADRNAAWELYVELLTRALAGAFENAEQRAAFRTELAQLQPVLTRYARALAELAQVEDLTSLEID